MTDKKKLALSRRQLLGGLGAVGAASAGAGLGTTALFSDEEEFENNTIQAGTTNLKVTLGLVEASNPSLMDINFDVKNDETADGTVVTGIQVGDMKPGDYLVFRTTVNVENNPMYVALEATDLSDSENTPNPEPEPQPGRDDGSDPEQGYGGTNVPGIPGGGDLDNEMDVKFGYDPDRTSLHDNNLEGSISLLGQEFGTHSATRFLSEFLRTGTSTGDPTVDNNGFLYRGRQGPDPSSGIPGGHELQPHKPNPKPPNLKPPTRIGGDRNDDNVDREKVTHFYLFNLSSLLQNSIMGDSFEFNLKWHAEQVRNNPLDSSADATDVIDGTP